MANEGALTVTIARCLGCRSCEIACAVAHSESGNLVESLREEPRPESRVQVEAVESGSVPLQCRHCEEAPCVAICPTAALEKSGPGQPVLVSSQRCIGCKYCVMVCPFGAIRLGAGGRVAVKCDLCPSRQQQGQLPACVEACKSGALRLESEQDAGRRKRRAAAEALKESEQKAQALARKS